jgi:2,3-bisphosphoglycerate-dependent phosphoglycerate mutase
MLELLLIRHGQTDWNVERRVMGMEPIGINATGRAQMEQMAAGLAAVSLDAIIASPAQRTRESADCLVTTSNGLDVTENDAYGEIVYGEWVGRPFRDFDALPAFEQYMYAPSTVQIPGGERLVDTQRRAVEGVERIRTERTDGRVAIVTHADIIKLSCTISICLSTIGNALRSTTVH